MLLLLVILCLYSFVKSDKRLEMYENYIYAVVQWHMFLLLLLYMLSAIKKVNFWGIILGIILINVILMIFLIRKIKNEYFTFVIIRNSIKSKFKDKEVWFYCIPILMFMLVLYITIRTVPYNYDSMTYHLPRIAHWAQNQSIAPYASNIDRQIGSTRIASYICLYLYILAGKTDILVNLVQCFSFGTNAIMVYAIARKLGIAQKFAVLSSMIFLSTPIAIAEATTTQNDNYASIWLLFFIYLLLDLNNKQKCLTGDKRTKKKIFYIAACIALGYLSKPSVCFAMLIFLIWTLVCVIKRRDKLNIIVQFLTIGIITIFVFLIPSVVENIYVFGSISPQNVGMAQLVGTLKPNYLLLNFLKTFTFNFGNSIIPNMKEWMGETLYSIADAFNVILDNVSISENGHEYGFGSYPYGCDTALQPLLMTLTILSILWCILRKSKKKLFQKEYCYCAMMSFIVLCIFMRWQSFITRYMIGYFALFCPLIVIQLEDFISVFRNKIYQKVIVLFIAIVCLINFGIAGAVNWKIDTKEYPRTYFYHVGNVRNIYEDICDMIRDKGYTNIGISCGVNSYEYPLWGILQYDEQEYTIKHVLVDGILEKYEDDFFVPDCIMLIDRSQDEIFEYNKQMYEIVNHVSDDDLRVYMYEKVSE